MKKTIILTYLLVYLHLISIILATNFIWQFKIIFLILEFVITGLLLRLQLTALDMYETVKSFNDMLMKIFERSKNE